MWFIFSSYLLLGCSCFSCSVNECLRLSSENFPGRSWTHFLFPKIYKSTESSASFLWFSGLDFSSLIFFIFQPRISNRSRTNLHQQLASLLFPSSTLDSTNPILSPTFFGGEILVLASQEWFLWSIAHLFGLPRISGCPLPALPQAI